MILSKEGKVGLNIERKHFGFVAYYLVCELEEDMENYL